MKLKIEMITVPKDSTTNIRSASCNVVCLMMPAYNLDMAKLMERIPTTSKIAYNMDASDKPSNEKLYRNKNANVMEKTLKKISKT